MKYLVATKETQGTRSNDFCFAEEGMFVIGSNQCDRGTVDDRCGCHRAMVTPRNGKATTTVKVVELDHAQLKQATKEIFSHFESWKIFNEKEVFGMVTDELAENRRLASSFPVGTVLEIRGNEIRVRTLGLAKSGQLVK